MLQEIASTRPVAGAPRLTMDESRAAPWAGDDAMTLLRGWVETYLMKGHPDLGRTGAVCPFTKQSGKVDAVRLAICRAGPTGEDEAFALVRRCFEELDAIPCKPGAEHFRTIILGFPNCADEAGMAMLQRVQRRHKYYSLSRFRMIGYMFPGSDAPGLWNREFRPLRAPLPVLAIRYLVEQDAPFAARHPLLLAPYLLKFRLAGLRRLVEYRRRQ